MPTFQPPKYSKVANQKTGAMEPCYTFLVDKNEDDRLCCLVSNKEQSASAINQVIQENSTWWNEWIDAFLKASAKHFSKPYTVQHIQKITKHQVHDTEDTVFPASVYFYPRLIQIVGGAFVVEWGYDVAPPITIPDLTEEVLPPASDLAESNTCLEMNVDEVPIDPNATDEVIRLDTPTKYYDKNKVKEARLKAKIAMYRAQHQMNRFYEKYGTEVTDSDTEGTSDEEEDEEVQL